MFHGRCFLGPLWVALLPALVCAADSADLAQYDAKIKPEDRQHWAFRPVVVPAVPAVKDSGWVRNPIDAFVLARLEAKGWQPAARAEPRVLLRRLYLDLIGLPPTPAEQETFLRDPSPDALLHVVEQLLSRPGHGERWARHWLDLVRYADTNGYERDGIKPSVWRYRDYVIQAFNNDKPYDRFILEQLAGDELADATPETLIATGYARLGPWDDEPADPKTDHFDQLDDIVSTTAQVFLGLTLGCARCHNHKFEALTALDYYRMVAIFHGLARPRNGRTELDLPALPRGSKDNPTAAGRGYFLPEMSPRTQPTHILQRGKADRPGAEVAPGVPAVLAVQQPAFLPPAAATSQRRLTLARWIANKDNPLTARVMVNRIWQYHFGEGLVRTPSDFGKMGQPPTHPELLDWLTDWFVREGWSIKKLHRLILDSNTWQMNKRWRAEPAAVDPENRLLWRGHYRRLEVEVILDSILAASGQLNLRLFGPSVFPPMAREALEGHSDPGKVWSPSPEREAARRTIYVHVKRSLLFPALEVLDFCDTARTTPRRNVTTVAPQALTLYNGELVNRQARYLAERLEKEAGTDLGRQIDLAFRLTLCRPAAEPERAALTAFVQQQVRDGATPAQARQQLARVVFNLNEFVYPD